MKYKRVPPAFVLLRSFNHEDEVCGRLLNELDSAIVRVAKRFAEIAKGGNGDYIDDIASDEAAYTEAIIGAGFVVAQAYITSVVSSVKRMAMRPLLIRSGVHLPSDKKGILCWGIQTVHGTCYTLPQAANAFADYFKHHEEWGLVWSRMSKKALKPAYQTIKTIRAFGMRQRSSGNLRTGLEALGYSDYRLHRLYPDLRSWSSNIERECKQLMAANGLLQK